MTPILPVHLSARPFRTGRCITLAREKDFSVCSRRGRSYQQRLNGRDINVPGDIQASILSRLYLLVTERDVTFLTKKALMRIAMKRMRRIIPPTPCALSQIGSGSQSIRRNTDSNQPRPQELSAGLTACDLRKSPRGLTQEELGAAMAARMGRTLEAGWGQKRISRFEAGGAEPTPEELSALATALGVDPQIVLVSIRPGAAGKAASLFNGEGTSEMRRALMPYSA